MPKGGARPGAGRKSGVPSKKTTARAAATAAIEASGLTPLEFLLAVMRDGSASPMARLDAAKAAAAYMHPRLAPIEVKPQEDDHVPLVERLKGYERRAAIDASAGKIVALRK